MFFQTRGPSMPSPDAAIPGRLDPIMEPGLHHVNGRPIGGPYPDGFEIADFAFGCFWGAEKVFWQTTGVWVTAVGYQGGFTPNATYREACSGKTGHAETVRVVFDPTVVTYEELLRLFWEDHDPTQVMRQGNDVGTQYRSAIYWDGEDQQQAAQTSRERYQQALSAGRHGEISTEIAQSGQFYYAEADHQQYLHKVPHGYCGLGGTGVSCPIGLVSAS